MGLFLQAVEGDCDIHVLKQDGQFSVLFTKCDSSPGRVDYSYYGYPVERVRKGSELVSTEADLATLLVMKRGSQISLSLGILKLFFNELFSSEVENRPLVRGAPAKMPARQGPPEGLSKMLRISL